MLEVLYRYIVVVFVLVGFIVVIGYFIFLDFDFLFSFWRRCDLIFFLKGCVLEEGGVDEFVDFI